MAKLSQNKTIYKLRRFIPVWLVWILQRFRLLRKYPETLTWFITERCNAKCEHCFIGEPRPEMDTQTAVKFAKTLKAKTVVITGGEPFIRKDLLEICQAIPTKNLVIITNGGLQSRIVEFCEKIDKKLAFQVSYDRDRVRGPKSMLRSYNTVRYLKKRYPVVVASMLPVDTKIISKAKNLGVFQSFNSIRGQKPETPPDLYPNTLISAMNKQKHAYQLKFYETGDTGLPCTAGKTGAVIYPNGDVALCEVLAPFGTTRNFKEFWKSAPKPPKDCTCGHDCAIVNSMPYDYKALKALL